MKMSDLKSMLLSVLMIATTQSKVISDPPIWPNAFSVDFQEDLYLSILRLSRNNGTWFYDYTNGRARYDHNRGQRNNFCNGQHLSDHDTKAPCSLLFTNHSNMYVFYPEAKTCCILCGEKQGCTILKPNWLSNATFTGQKTFNGVKCNGWAKPGHVFTDELYVSDKGVPCQYHEKSYEGDIIHTLTFNQATYKVGQPDSATFEIPTYCKSTCPHPYP